MYMIQACLYVCRQRASDDCLGVCPQHGCSAKEFVCVSSPASLFNEQRWCKYAKGPVANSRGHKIRHLARGPATRLFAEVRRA